jgi:hypothetical protein
MAMPIVGRLEIVEVESTITEKRRWLPARCDQRLSGRSSSGSWAGQRVPMAIARYTSSRAS